MVLHRHVAVGDEEQDHDGRDAEGEAVGVGGGQGVGEAPLGEVGTDVAGQEQGGATGQDAEQRTDREQLGGLLLPFQPAAVGARLDLLREGRGVGVEGLGVVQRAPHEALAGQAAEDDAGQQA